MKEKKKERKEEDIFTINPVTDIGAGVSGSVEEWLDSFAINPVSAVGAGAINPVSAIGAGVSGSVGE